MQIKRIDNNNPIINISGNVKNSNLSFNGQKITSIKEMERGTVEFLISNLNYSESEINTQLENYRKFLLKLNTNHDLTQVIFDTFSPILGTGNYLIKTEQIEKDFRLLEYFDSSQSFYGGNKTLIALQKISSLNQEIVEKYKKEIRSNNLPYIVVLGLLNVDNCINYYYILDGHHKAKAYEELGIAPNTIIFEKIPDDKKEKIIYYQNHICIYQKRDEATLVEWSLQLNLDYKDKAFGTLSKREMQIHPTKWSSGAVISKKESELIQKEVDDFFLANNIFVKDK